VEPGALEKKELVEQDKMIIAATHPTRMQVEAQVPEVVVEPIVGVVLALQDPV